MNTKSIAAVVAVIVVVAVVAAAAYAILGGDGGSDDTPGTDVPDTPGGEDSGTDTPAAYEIRTDVRVGDTVTMTSPSDSGDPMARVVFEAVDISDGTVTYTVTVTEDGETDVIEDSIPTSYFPQVYWAYIAFGDGSGPGDPVLVGTETVETARGQMDCEHWSLDGYYDVWYYPGIEYAAVLVVVDGATFLIDSSMLEEA